MGMLVMGMLIMGICGVDADNVDADNVNADNGEMWCGCCEVAAPQHYCPTPALSPHHSQAGAANKVCTIESKPIHKITIEKDVKEMSNVWLWGASAMCIVCLHLAF